MNSIEMYAGTSVTRTVTITNSVTGLVEDLTGAALEFRVADAKYDTARFVRKNAIAGGDAFQIEETDLVNGEFKVHIIPANTASLEPRKYWYQVWITLAGNTYMALEDEIDLKGGITE